MGSAPLPYVASAFFPHALSGFGALAYAVVLTLVAIGLMFSGRSVIKGLAFLVAGLAGAAFGAGLGSTVLGWQALFSAECWGS